MNRNHYTNVHVWLNRHHGSADHCSNPDCNGKSQTYDWALKKGYEYEKNINNFIQLCRICHSKYDGLDIKAKKQMSGNIPWNKGIKTGPSGRKGMRFPDEWKNNIKKSKMGKTLSDEHKLNIKKGLKKYYENNRSKS